MDSASIDLPDRTFRFASEIVVLCRDLNRSAAVDRSLTRQLLRSGTSIGANVEEAQGSQSRADFVAKLYISCKEARETHYWLRLLATTKSAPPQRLAAVMDEAGQLVAILTSIVKNAKQSGKR